MLEAQWILSAEQMAEIDRRASEQIGIDGELLMEAAGHAIWREIAALRTAGGPLVCVAGPGNNGGDALVVARLAHNAGIDDLAVIVFGGSGSRTLARRAVIERLGVRLVDWQADESAATALLAGAATVVDGLFGNGLTRTLTEPARVLVSAINASPATVVAIDLPSGLREVATADDAVVQADATVVCGYHPARCAAAGGRRAGRKSAADRSGLSAAVRPRGSAAATDAGAVGRPGRRCRLAAAGGCGGAQGGTRSRCGGRRKR